MATNYTAAQQANMKLITDALIKKGVTNQYVHAAVLAVVGKETNFNPSASEVSYAKTANDRIRNIFSSTKKLNDTQLNALKVNPVTFFNHVYNGVAGNGPTDGYKYRGRGYNQLTGRANYATTGKALGVDLINNPDLLAKPEIAAAALVDYFVKGYALLKSKGKTTTKTINDFTNLNDSLQAIYHINAGVGHSNAVIQADVTGGLAKAKASIAKLYEYALNNKAKAATGLGAALFFLPCLAMEFIR